MCGPWMLWMRRIPKISNISIIFINIYKTYKVDFKISGGSLNFQIIIRYFKYFNKKHFLF